ncbi:hypothetical protein [Citrobacter amalonaticus]|uniref:hypothetical protein n=1 Tax=Citrobacter amalonaticus TaxID=35703 RepID=UPI0012E97EFB|nr:hypothetical protein [Citrobacter amalonaticus]HCB1822935.1 hypothetical protein [Citrobacter amalonaticus]HCB1901282.1 hypothetical protein [Citrobacter amalonaticus]
MDDFKCNLLFEHYKSNVETLKTSNNRRDLLFLMLIVSIMLIAIQTVNSDFVNGVLVSVGKINDKKLPGDQLLLLTFGIASFVLFVKYTQACFFADMLYKYISSIEVELNKLFPTTNLFTFEGDFYKREKSFYRRIISFFYKRIFPAILLAFLSLKLYFEIHYAKLYDVYFIITNLVFIVYWLYVTVYLIRK